MVGEEEYQVSGPTATEEFQAEYTDCHTHGAATLVFVPADLTSY
jgi:zinc transporter 1/2/3